MGEQEVGERGMNTPLMPLSYKTIVKLGIKKKTKNSLLMKLGVRNQYHLTASSIIKL